MFRVERYPHGIFSWAELASTNPQVSRDFFCGLMGWTTDLIQMEQGPYFTFKHGEHQVAATYPLWPEIKAQGLPSTWQTYITVDDVDATHEKVVDLGGTVIMPPFDDADVGRTMILRDNLGMDITVWQAAKGIGAGIVNTPGAMAWNELMTTDLEKSLEFYAGLLGWQFQADGDDYRFILTNGRIIGGIGQLPAVQGDVKAGWDVFFSVSDLQTAVNYVNSNGGRIVVPETEASANGNTIGRFAMIADPTGATCTLIQLNQPQPWQPG